MPMGAIYRLLGQQQPMASTRLQGSFGLDNLSSFSTMHILSISSQVSTVIFSAHRSYKYVV